jgi:hypothetical protein
MRWRRVSRVAGAVLVLGLLAAGPAAAQPDHLHADLALVGCGTLQATGFELPAGSRLDIRFENAASDATLHQASARTGADGAMTLRAKVPLSGVKTVRMTISRPGAAKPFAFSELTIAGECPLPFTGPARLPTLAGLALALLLAGAVLVRAAGHRPGRGARVP